MKINLLQSKLNKEQKKFLNVMEKLTFRELNILVARYLLGDSLDILSVKYNVDVERIRQLEQGALKKITLYSNLYACHKNGKQTGDLPVGSRGGENDREA